MISAGILEEFQGAVLAFFAGVLLTAGYDLLRIFRRVISHGNFWIGVEDFIFWTAATFWSFYVLYRENDGNLRMYTIISMVFGMLAYHQTISEPLVTFFGRLFSKLFSMCKYPFKKVKSSMIFLEKKLKNRRRSFIMRKIHRLSKEHGLGGGDSDGNEGKEKKEI